MKVQVELPSIQRRLRLGLTFFIAIMMVSSTATVMLFNPAQVLAYSRITENSNGPSNPPPMSQERSPSVSSSSTTPTIQAPLQIPRTLQSTDLVNSLAFYEVTFITSTTGPIDKIRMDFPAGTGIGAAGIIERVGIGGGTLLKSGSSITYDVTSPISIPAGTFIRLEMFGIKNPVTPSSTFTADITTRDSGGNLIDGPSQTNVYTIKKVGSSDLADGSVTSTKPAESFMKRVTLRDDAGGNAQGWNPDGVTTAFLIIEPAFTSVDSGFVSIALNNAGNVVCVISGYQVGSFSLGCTSPVNAGAELHYVVGNLPSHAL